MAFANFAYTNNSAGVCSGMDNRGVNGDLCALLHTALTSGSNWTRVYNGSNHMIWQPNGGGPVLSCQHDSSVSGNAGLAVIRLAESQSSGALTDPCPTPAQVANNNCNWLVSNSASPSRDFHIVAWETGVIYASKFSGTADAWDIGVVCQMIPRFASDTTYNWVIAQKAAVGVSYGVISANASSLPVNSASKVWTLRDVRGTAKSEAASFRVSGGSLGGGSAAIPAIRAGYGNSVDRERVGVHGNGATTSNVTAALSVPFRGVIPHLWSPLHSSLAGVGDTDTLMDGASQFVLLRATTTAGVLLRITNDEITTFPTS